MIRPSRRAFAMITASMYFMILAGCGGGDSGPTSPTPSTPTPTPTPPPPPAPVATSIAVTPSSHTLATIGATVQLTATVRDQNNNPMSGQTVNWTSSNTAVATVSGNGLVTAVSNGTSQITARSGNASGTANITVAEPVPTRITITPSSHTLEAIGATVQLSATVRDQRNNIMSGQTITWTSSDEAVVTVDGDGLVTAVGNGMTEITAKTGNLSSSAAITVANPVPTTVTVDPASHTLEAIGTTVQLAAVVLDQHENVMTDVAVTWSSGDEAVATVDQDGLVTAVDNGMAEITAQAGDAMGSAAITVAQAPASVSIAVESGVTTLTVIGQTLQLTVSVSDANDNPIAESDVTWTSSDEAVVTVDQDGLVTAVGNGMADVVAMVGDASHMVSITVMETSVPVATSVTVEPASHTLEAIGATVQLAAMVLDQDGNEMADVTVTWSSSDEAVATVDGDGLVTAVDNGMAEITAKAGDVMGSAEITVAQVPAGISIEVDAEATTLTEIGQTLQLMVTVSDANDAPISEPAVTWTSRDEAVVTVDGEGLVTAVSNGMADIVATAGDVSDMVNIKVMVPAEPVATTVTVEPASQTLEAIGETVQLAAVVLDQHENVMADVAVTWSSGDEAVATVDADGLVTAVDNGMAEITAQAGDAMGSAAITVAQVPVSITIEVAASATTTLTAIGETLQLMVSASDANNAPISESAVIWTSSDEAVVTVDGDGLVTAVGNGMADVVATAGDASDMVSIKVMVPAEPVAKTVTIEPASHTLEAIGHTVQLAAVVLDQHENVMADVAVTWSSGDETVATVDADGLVTAVDNGMAEITAQAGDAMGSAAITVAQAPAGISIEVEAEATTLTEIGQTLQLMVSVSDANDNPIAEPAVMWTSSDEAVVTVDGDGLVTAVGNGMADVEATAGDVSDTVGIAVMVPAEPVATTVTVEPASHTLEAIGETVQLAAVVLDQHENVMADVVVAWSSGDETVVTVDGDGLVTAVDNGMAEITAKAGEAMGSAAITVAQAPAGISIEVEAEATTLTEIGQTLQLMVSVSDANDNPIAEPAVMWTSSDEAVVTVDGDGLVTAVSNGMADVEATAGDVSDTVGIAVMVTVEEVTYVPWIGVRVEPGKLIFTTPGGLGLSPTTCFTEDPILGLLLPPEGIKDWKNTFTNDTLTVHYSVWQTRADMDSPWNEIEGTREMYDACPYDPDVAGEYRLVGDITLNGERELRRSENTFIVE